MRRPIFTSFLLVMAISACRSTEATVTTENSVMAKLTVSAPPTVRYGERITVNVEMTNLGGTTIVLPGGNKDINTDFYLMPKDSLVLAVPGAIQTLELSNDTVAPGGVYRFSRTWGFTNGSGNRVPEGTYRIRTWTSIPGNPAVLVEASPVMFTLTK